MTGGGMTAKEKSRPRYQRKRPSWTAGVTSTAARRNTMKMLRSNQLNYSTFMAGFLYPLWRCFYYAKKSGTLYPCVQR